MAPETLIWALNPPAAPPTVTVPELPLTIPIDTDPTDTIAPSETLADAVPSSATARPGVIMVERWAPLTPETLTLAVVPGPEAMVIPDASSSFPPSVTFKFPRPGPKVAPPITKEELVD